MENQEIHAEVFLGVDTHLDVHVGVFVDTIGRVLGPLSVCTHDKGHQQLLWTAGLRPLACYAALALKEPAFMVQL